jgi:hypothetical protein
MTKLSSGVRSSMVLSKFTDISNYFRSEDDRLPQNTFLFFAKHFTINVLVVQRPTYIVYFNLSSSLFYL